MAKMLERQVKEHVKRVLDRHGAHRYMPVPGGLGVMGAHDFICCHKGRYFTVEAKREGIDEMSAHQENFRDGVLAAGGKVFLVNGAETLAELDAWLGTVE